MKNQYGPWATSIDAGGNPQLSAFWRRRLTMLVPTSRTSPTLSRRNLLWLSIAAVLTLVLPTFRPAAAVADDPADKPSSTAGTETKSDAAPRRGTYSGFVTTAGGPSGKTVPVSETGEELDSFPPMDFYLPVYTPLTHEKVRKELGLSSQQEAKLRAICGNYSAERQLILEPIRTELAALPPFERQTKMFAAIKPLNKSIRKQIEEVLTPAQLTALKKIVLCERTWELHPPKFLLSKEQSQERGRLMTQGMKETDRLHRENDEKSLAILSSQQREELERKLAQSDVLQLVFFRHPSFPFISPPGVGAVFYNTLFKELGPDNTLGDSGQHQTKLQAVCQSQPAQELFELHAQLFGDPRKSNVTRTMAISTDGGAPGDGGPQLSLLEQRLAQHPEMQKKWTDLSNQLRRQIEALFTPEQLAALKKVALRKLEVQNLRNPLTLSELPTAKQQEVRRLHEERTWIKWQVDQATGAKVLEVLTPQQREQFTQMMEHRDWSALPDQ